MSFTAEYLCEEVGFQDGDRHERKRLKDQLHRDCLSDRYIGQRLKLQGIQVDWWKKEAQPILDQERAYCQAKRCLKDLQHLNNYLRLEISFARRPHTRVPYDNPYLLSVEPRNTPHMISNIDTLRTELINNIERIKKEPRFVAQAVEINNAAGKIISSLKVQIEHMKTLKKVEQIDFMKPTKE